MGESLLYVVSHPAFSAVTFLAGLLLGNYFSLYRDRRIEFNQAALEFRRSFGDVLRIIRGDEHRFDLKETLTTAYGAHTRALDDFMPWLSNHKKTAIQKAWNFHCWNSELGKTRQGQEMFAHYNYLDNDEDNINCNQLALDNIERILRFASIR